MKCIYCGTPLTAIDYCTECGADITIQKRVMRISNLYYNEGLEKAQVRDLSGAADALNRSLKFNKDNVAARNLLGLVYYETGEIVAALSEWVISKNMNIPGNIAEYYLEQVQKNKNRLNTLNLTVQKYNQALVYCRDDNEDMAIIQLKKVVEKNPNFVKALQLLALLYMKNHHYEKARKLLKKALRVDMTNTTTLRYLAEIEAETGVSAGVGTGILRRSSGKDEGYEEGGSGPIRYMSGNDMVIRPTTFRDSSGVATFINIFLGILIGAAVVFYLIVPEIRENSFDQANRKVAEANAKLASVEASTSSLQEQIESYEEKISDANEAIQKAGKTQESYDELLIAASAFIGNNPAGTAEALPKIDMETLDGTAQVVYQQLVEGTSSYLFEQYIQNAANAYLSGDYQTAIEQYELAVQCKDDYEAYYYLGFAYYNVGNFEKADEMFHKIEQLYPDKAKNVTAYITNKNGAPAAANAMAGNMPDPNAEMQDAIPAEGMFPEGMEGQGLEVQAQ